MSILSDNLHRVQDRIAGAAQRARRDPSAITLVAVGKTHPPETILEAYELGVRHFGENRVEEASAKIPVVQPPIVWHMIGHVQSRKADEVAALFEWVQSVDSLRLAQRLSRFAAQRGKTLRALLEFNVSGEDSKYGLCANCDTIDADDTLLKEIEAILALPNLRVEGLMTMAPIAAEVEQAQPVFRTLRELRQHLAQRFPQCAWHHLSMGMTDDFEVAIEEGATMVRIGRAIFGERRTTKNE
jgi:pyridoxal phosphate enzyme (YggS family)